jgi:hypothetical protein
MAVRGKRGADLSSVTVGYGAGGGYAFEFTLPPGRSLDTGFLKLFVSTDDVNMDWITQLSPLDPAFSARGVRKEMPNSGVWDAWIAAITVIDKAPAAGA